MSMPNSMPVFMMKASSAETLRENFLRYLGPKNQNTFKVSITFYHIFYIAMQN